MGIRFSIFHVDISFVDGENMDMEDVEEVANAQVVIGTPGRMSAVLRSLHDCNPQLLRTIEVLILDEADRLLAMGFQRQLGEILDTLPKQRRTVL